MRPRKGHYKGPQFSYTNPPPSREAAEKRLDEVSKIIELIKSELETVQPQDYYSEEDYADWKQRATAALAHLRREFKFVDRWLRPNNSGRSQHKVDEAFEAIHERASEEAREIERMCRLAEPPQVPRDINQARDRLTILVSATQHITDLNQDFNRQWAAHGQWKGGLTLARAPIQKVNGLLAREITSLRRYIHAQEQGLKSSNWQAVCVEALGRAIAQGLQLTSVEQEVYEKLCKYVSYVPTSQAK